MSLRKPEKEQPDQFEFTAASLAAAKEIVSKYTDGKPQRTVMALLYIAQKQNDNWMPRAASELICQFLVCPYTKVN